MKGDTKDCFLSDGWLSSKNSEEDAADVNAGMIGMVKTNKKVFCNETIENLTKYRTGGSYLVLRSKPMVRPLIDIGYKYNTRKVLSFIVTEDSGSTKAGITYLSKYPEQF